MSRGFPEVIWEPGKTPEQIAQIMEVMRDRGSVVMATRIEPAVYAQLEEKVAGLNYYPSISTFSLRAQLCDSNARIEPF